MNNQKELSDNHPIEVPIPERAPEPANPGELPDINADINKTANSEEAQKCQTDNEPLGQPPYCDPEGNGEDVN